MPPSSKFLTEPTGEKIVKIGQYLAKIWKKYNSLLFLAHPVLTTHTTTTTTTTTTLLLLLLPLLLSEPWNTECSTVAAYRRI